MLLIQRVVAVVLLCEFGLFAAAQTPKAKAPDFNAELRSMKELFAKVEGTRDYNVLLRERNEIWAHFERIRESSQYDKFVANYSQEHKATILNAPEGSAYLALWQRTDGFRISTDLSQFSREIDRAISTTESRLLKRQLIRLGTFVPVFEEIPAYNTRKFVIDPYRIRGGR